MNSRFQASCEAAALAWDVPALAVGISVGGAAETYAVGCDPTTRFRVASITKPFTATLALELLDLEAETGLWPADVRVRHLLSHTSGYDCELPERDQARFGDDDGALAATVAELGSVRRFLGVEEAWSYANTGYWLAGHLCSRAAGTSFEEAMVRRILRPAGLESTSFGEPEIACFVTDPTIPWSFHTLAPAGRPAASCPMSPTCCGSARGTSGSARRRG